MASVESVANFNLVGERRQTSSLEIPHIRFGCRCQGTQYHLLQRASAENAATFVPSLQGLGSVSCLLACLLRGLGVARNPLARPWRLARSSFSSAPSRVCFSFSLSAVAEALGLRFRPAESSAVSFRVERASKLNHPNNSKHDKVL